MKKNTFRNSLIISVFVAAMFGIISFTAAKKGPSTSNKKVLHSRESIPGTEEGTIINFTFFSKSLNLNRDVQVYLPEGFSQESSARYPVIYFLHGGDQNSYSLGQLFPIFNRLTDSKAISPLILVKPDGSCPPWGRSYYTNSELYGDFEDYIVYDLVECIDSVYPTIASRDKRAIMGWSMGGYGAMKIALKHPDIFCGVAAHSGMLNMWMVSQFFPSLLSENGGTPVSVYRPDAGFASYGSFAITGAFSPNLNNPPYFVDYPLDCMGNWIDSVRERWSLNNCPFLARNITRADDLAIYFDCGTEDETMTYPFNSSFADSLDMLGLPYEFRSFPGGHDATDRYPIGLAFLDSIMN